MTNEAIFLGGQRVIGFGEANTPRGTADSRPATVMIEAIVPAYNEAPTIEAVIAALRSAPSVARIVIVDDGSKDNTSTVASQACDVSSRACDVVRMSSNGGKGKAMLAGLRATTSDHVGFFDADLYGLKPEHIELMVAASVQGFDMVCGLRDYGLLFNPWQLTGPVITGERILTRQLLDKIPESCWSGYAIETAMNDAARRNGARTVCFILPGVTMRNKVQKDGGYLNGLWGHVKMAREIVETSRNLEDSCGTSCAVSAR